MEIICPYCKKKFNLDQNKNYQDDVKYKTQCPKCGKWFVFQLYDTDCLATKAPCLNGGQHDYQLIKMLPEEESKMRCSICNQERELTDEEKEKYRIWN